MKLHSQPNMTARISARTVEHDDDDSDSHTDLEDLLAQMDIKEKKALSALVTEDLLAQKNIKETKMLSAVEADRIATGKEAMLGAHSELFDYMDATEARNTANLATEREARDAKTEEPSKENIFDKILGNIGNNLGNSFGNFVSPLAPAFASSQGVMDETPQTGLMNESCQQHA